MCLWYTILHSHFPSNFNHLTLGALFSDNLSRIKQKAEFANEMSLKNDLQLNQLSNMETRNRELSDNLAELQQKYESIQKENKNLLDAKSQHVAGKLTPICSILFPLKTINTHLLRLCNRDSSVTITARRFAKGEGHSILEGAVSSI